VAANSLLRERLLDLAVVGELQVVLPSVGLCTDNAAMVGAVAAYRLDRDGPTPLDTGAWPGLRL
jgi:N6-L-threonylcarbamoyladenine synthase